MSPDDFRRIALMFPGAVEGSHQGHPDFRVGGKIFASLGWPDSRFGMVKLTPEQQQATLDARPAGFRPVGGGWGRRGSTSVALAEADEKTLSSAMLTAWRNLAPKGLLSAVGKQADASSPASGRTSLGCLEQAVARLRAAAAAAGLPALEEGTSYGTFALKLKGKMLVRVRDAETLVLRCSFEDKELLLAAAPDVYFETEHYRGWPALLIRLAKIDDAELQHCLCRAWKNQAPARRPRRGPSAQ